MNDDYQPTEDEESVLDVFKSERRETGESRLNPYYIREKTELGKGSVNTALSNLRAAGWVQRVTRGLYEFVNDPREGNSGSWENVVDTENPGTKDEDAGPAPVGDASSLEAEMEQVLADLDVTGRPREVEDARREAIKYAWRRLREEGKMQPRELANETFHEFNERGENIGYSASGSRYDGYQLWDGCMRDVLRELPGVHPGSGSGRWTFEDNQP